MAKKFEDVLKNYDFTLSDRGKRDIFTKNPSNDIKQEIRDYSNNTDRENITKFNDNTDKKPHKSLVIHSENLKGYKLDSKNMEVIKLNTIQPI